MSCGGNERLSHKPIDLQKLDTALARYCSGDADTPRAGARTALPF